MARIPSYLLNLAGEYRVCSELNKREIFATVTYGTRKGVDLYAISDRRERALKIEVKTSQRSKFVTSLSQKSDDDPNSRGFWKRRVSDKHSPDFWVFHHIHTQQGDSFNDRFFVLTHKEICKAQSKRNRIYAKKHLARHGRLPDFSTGVDNVTVADIRQHEDAWKKIIIAMGGAET